MNQLVIKKLVVEGGGGRTLAPLILDTYAKHRFGPARSSPSMNTGAT